VLYNSNPKPRGNDRVTHAIVLYIAVAIHWKYVETVDQAEHGSVMATAVIYS